MLAHELHHRKHLRVLAAFHRLNHLLRGREAGRLMVETHHLADSPRRRLQRGLYSEPSVGAERDRGVELVVLLGQAAVAAAGSRHQRMVVEATASELAKFVTLV